MLHPGINKDAIGDIVDAAASVIIELHDAVDSDNAIPHSLGIDPRYLKADVTLLENLSKRIVN